MNLEDLVKEAEALFEKEKFQEIIQLLPDDVLEEHKDARLYAWRARTHYRIGHSSELIMYYAEKAISADQDYFMGYVARGNSWVTNKEFDKAITDYTIAIELNPYYSASYYARGYSWAYKGEDDNAIVDYTKVIELKPNDAVAYFARGYLWDNKGENDQSIDDYTKAIDLKPDFADAYYNRAFSNANKGEYDNAIADYTKAIQLNPNNSDAYCNRGSSWVNKGEYDKAIADCTLAIELNPKYAIAFRIRAVSFKYKSEYEKSMMDCEKAIELEPDYAAAFYIRGILFNDKGEYKKAIDDFTQAINLKPDYFDAYNYRGISHYFSGELNKAIADYTDSIKLKPVFAFAYKNRGSSWYALGNFDKAIADYTTAIELKPDYANAYYDRGVIRLKNETELEESIKDFESFINLTPFGQNDIWVTAAKNFIQELKEKIKDKQLSEIDKITLDIQKLLLISKGCITHYTGLTKTKILLLDNNSKFQISEGAFLNDTSEGTEFYKFLNYKSTKVKADGLLAQTFAPKPFIGSFVAQEKHDDLNLWRFYGKENGIEAQGCALTIHLEKFSRAINDVLTKGQEKQGFNIESDISFYRVAYRDHSSKDSRFSIPNSSKQDENKLNKLLQNLKEKVEKYENEDRTNLEKYLNKIAFLFKSDVYKNENEIRLVLKGIEFDKKFDTNTSPPRVFIELVNIRELVEQITIGPKVDKSDEWAAAFYYSYIKNKQEIPKILISRLPYK
jgi:tetratricopeptide (TPR) repeat protein